MMTYMEWGAFLITAIGCLWKYYGKPQDLLEKAHKIYKKLEGILIGPNSTSIKKIKQKTKNCDPDPSLLWEKNDLLKEPVKRREFQKRSQDNGFKPRRAYEETRFITSQESIPEIRNADWNCPVCTDPDKLARVASNEETGFTNCLYPVATNHHGNPWIVRKFAYFIHWMKKWALGYQHHYISLKQIMECERLNAAMEEQARQDFEERKRKGTCRPGENLATVTDAQKSKTRALVANMRAKMPKPHYFSMYARVAPWIIGKTLEKIYPRILVKDSQMDELRKVRETGMPLLYLPLHRSHVDYVLVSWSLVGNDIRSPVVAAGDNLNNIPIFSLMMKSVGGFFIKRRLDKVEGKKDFVYRQVLHTYMTESLLEDNDMEFFVEGGRTRTGKPCLPKGGLLSIMVDALLSQKVEDIYVVPVNFSYDRLLEGSFARELLGQSKVRESFASAFLGLWNSLQAKFGNARVDFGHPFSMKGFIQSFQASKNLPPIMPKSSNTGQILGSKVEESIVQNVEENNNNQVEAPFKKTLETRTSISSIYGTDVVIEDQREMVINIAKHALNDGIKCFSLMSSHAIAFLMLSKFRSGVELETLTEAVQSLGEEFLNRGHDVGYNSSDIQQLMEHGLKVLGPSLIRREMRNSKIYIVPATLLPNVIELNYYSTCVLPVYSLEAVIATSLLLHLKNKPTAAAAAVAGEKIQISRLELLSTCSELARVLHHEFIFHPPCTTLPQAAAEKLKDFATQGLISYNEGDTFVELEIGSKKVLDRLVFLKNLLRPVIDTYVASAGALPRLVGGEAVEKFLHMEMLAEIKISLQEKRIKYAESAILDPIKNCIKLLQNWDVLDTQTRGKDTIFFLRDPFDDHKIVQNVIHRLEKFQI